VVGDGGDRLGRWDGGVAGEVREDCGQVLLAKLGGPVRARVGSQSTRILQIRNIGI